MAMDVFVANEQSTVHVDERRLISLARAVATEEGISSHAELSILLVDREAMASLKERYLGDPGPTDVLAFPMDEQVVEDEPLLIGDIVVCPDVAREQATKARRDVSREVDLLIVHGFLHLLGYDHARPQEAKAMRHRERKVLHAFYEAEGA